MLLFNLANTVTHFALLLRRAARHSSGVRYGAATGLLATLLLYVLHILLSAIGLVLVAFHFLLLLFKALGQGTWFLLRRFPAFFAAFRRLIANAARGIGRFCRNVWRACSPSSED